MGKRIDLTGQRFGRLVVVSCNEEVTKQKKGVYWNCKCDCGNEKIVLGLLLKNGHTNSCGCYGIEKSRERIIKIAEEKWKDKEFRKMMSNKTKEQWKDTEFIQKQKNGIKDKWKDNKYRQMQSDRMRGKIGENSIHWKGGITPISIYLRGLNEQWFNDCKQQANYTCELTKKVGGKLHTHHLKAFNAIVLEAHELHNIEVHEMIGEYTQEELHIIEEYVESWHKDSSNAVVLCEEVHNLFHKLYGKGGNTPEQYIEFKQRYLNGEFKEIIK